MGFIIRGLIWEIPIPIVAYVLFWGALIQGFRVLGAVQASCTRESSEVVESRLSGWSGGRRAEARA